MAYSTHASKLNLPVAAAHQINGGMTPGRAPTTVHRGVFRLSYNLRRTTYAVPTRSWPTAKDPG